MLRSTSSSRPFFELSVFCSSSIRFRCNVYLELQPQTMCRGFAKPRHFTFDPLLLIEFFILASACSMAGPNILFTPVQGLWGRHWLGRELFHYNIARPAFPSSLFDRTAPTFARGRSLQEGCLPQRTAPSNSVKLPTFNGARVYEVFTDLSVVFTSRPCGAHISIMPRRWGLSDQRSRSTAFAARRRPSTRTFSLPEAGKHVPAAASYHPIPHANMPESARGLRERTQERSNTKPTMR